LEGVFRLRKGYQKKAWGFLRIEGQGLICKVLTSGKGVFCGKLLLKTILKRTWQFQRNEVKGLEKIFHVGGGLGLPGGVG